MDSHIPAKTRRHTRMPQFTWTGRDARQVMRSGVIDAPSTQQVAEALAAMSLVPVAIMPFPPSPQEAAAAAAARRQSARIGMADRLELARQMSTLLRAGVPPVRAFTGLMANTGNPAMLAVLEEMETQVKGGDAMWRTMARQPAVFDEFGIAIVRQGEENGALAESFKTLYLHLEFHDFMQAQARSARRLPLALAFTLGSALLLALLWFVPMAAGALAELPGRLPGLTQLLLSLSEKLRGAIWLLVGIAGSAWLLSQRGPSLKPIQRLTDRLRLLEPLSGPLLRDNAIARLCGSLALGQRSGLPLSRNLQLAGVQAGNAHLRACVEDLRLRVEQGENLCNAFADAGILNAEAQQTLDDGEANGTLHEALVDITQHYRGEAELAHRTMLHRFDWLLIIGLAALALLLAAGLLLPLLAGHSSLLSAKAVRLLG